MCKESLFPGKSSSHDFIPFSPPLLTDPSQLPAMIVCSSGSTGSPKAIPLSHAFLAYMFQASFGLPNSVRFFSFSTLFWMSGFFTLLNGTMNNCTRVIVRRPFNVHTMLEIIKTRKIGMLVCPPAQLQMLLLEKFQPEDLQSILAVFCTGGAVPQSLIDKFKIPIVPGYGMTEAGGIAINGQLMPNNVVKIIDDGGNKLGVGERGEICVQIALPFLGYYRNKAATEDMLKEGFIHTGDIGLFDEAANLHIVDRKKEIFKFNNFHINPTDIEKQLQQLPGIGMVSVVGIPHSVFGCLPAAMIIRSEDATITEQDVHLFAKNNLSHYNLLRGGVYFVDSLPMTVSGKILRRVATTLATELYEKNPDIGFKY